MGHSGRFKIDNFFLISNLSQHPVDPNPGIACADSEGGQGVQTWAPPGKTQAIWVSLCNKQLDPPPGKKLDA